MTLYEMPAQNPYQKPFRLVAGVVLVLLLVILCISAWIPAQLSDELRKMLAWVAGAIVAGAIVAAQWLGAKQGLWKARRGLQIAVSDGKLIQTRPGGPSVEIPLSQIASVHRSRGGWLIVRGSDAEKHIAIPKDIVGFENLKQEISASKTTEPLRTKRSPFLILLAALFLGAFYFLFTSHNRALVTIAGSSVLAIQLSLTFPLWRALRSKHKAVTLLVLTYILEIVTVGWIVYERAFRM